MNLEDTFCPNINCPARGQTRKDNIRVHSQKEKRCRCMVCNKTFAYTKGTPFYRLHKQPEQMTKVITLLSHGCPRQAIVHAFDLDERTVQSWWLKAGKQAQKVHQHVVASQTLDLGQVQADEIKAKVQGGYLWMAMAIMVSTRLWLGGVISPKRDRHLIDRLAQLIRQIALCRPLLLAVDGLPSYLKAFARAFRSKVPRCGQKGRPFLYSWPNIAVVRLIKKRTHEGFDIRREIAQGTAILVERLRQQTQGHLGVINTAYIERLNATFRQRLSCLARRSRHLARQQETLEAGMFLVGCLYNLCQPHHSLRLQLSVGLRGHRWIQRTPAMASGLTDHIWTVDELLRYKVPPPRWQPPKRRGRPSKELQKLIQMWC